jgi:hypothetical protein
MMIPSGRKATPAHFDRVSSLTQIRPEILVQPLEPRRRVHRIAQRRVVHLQEQRAEIADGRLAGMDADTSDAESDPFAVPRGAEAFGIVIDLQGAFDCPLGMVGLLRRSVEDGKNCVTDELVRISQKMQSALRRVGRSYSR